MVILLSVFISCTKATGENIHPRYKLSMDEFERMISDIPEDLRKKIADEPVLFLETLAPVLEHQDILFALVDKGHGLPPDFVPDDLVDLAAYNVVTSRDGLLVSSSIMPDTLAMVEAARQDSVELVFSSAYR